MTKRKTAPELVEGAINNLKTMRQHRDALDEGLLDENDIEIMALRRVLTQIGGDDDIADAYIESRRVVPRSRTIYVDVPDRLEDYEEEHARDFLDRLPMNLASAERITDISPTFGSHLRAKASYLRDKFPHL